MKTKFFQPPRRAGASHAPRGRRGLAAWFGLLLATGVSVQAMPSLDTLSGGPTQFNPLPYGYADGDTALEAQFNTPWGLALNPAATLLYVADRDNDSIRLLYLGANITTTFTTDQISKPVGVAVDEAGFVYVLNRGNGNNGSLLRFDPFGALVESKATGLTNAAGLALDASTNVYVTVRSNTILRVTPGNAVSTVATVTNAGASLQGIVVTDNGLLATCDSGRHVILLVNPFTGTNSVLSGLANTSGDVFGTKNNARYRAPHGITKSGGGLLVVADHGNHRVKVVTSLGTSTNLYGVKSNFWYTGAGALPGWWDGDVCLVDMVGCPEGRQPVGVVCANDGTVYSTETYYHLLRKTTGTGLPPFPPPPPPVPTPQIGWVDYTVPPSTIVSILRSGTSFIFNNDVTVAIAGTEGTETHYTAGPTFSSLVDPSDSAGSTPPAYWDGMYPAQVPLSIVEPQPDVTVKAIGFQAGRPSSVIATARFQWKAASPQVTGNNAALFTISSETIGSEMWFTVDGSDPTNEPPSLPALGNPATVSLSISSNTTFKVRAFRNQYQPSSIVSQSFSPTNYDANKISFGFANGEASSDFVASAGQFFYAPVTLTVLQGTKVYSLQFNLTVTNAGALPGPAVSPGAVGFESFLTKKLAGGGYEIIPPLMFYGLLPNPPPAELIVPYDGLPFVDLTFTNSANNLLGVGWLERYGYTNLYNTLLQDLITYSQPHDTIFNKENGRVVVGGYAFQVPGGAAAGETYQIKIGLPSATSDGVGAPGSGVFIDTPTNGAPAGGAINSIKTVTVGQRKYVAGDAAPFRWFNAGDFGNSNLLNDDVMQVFQSAIYRINFPAEGSDFMDAMDSCCGVYAAAPGTDYLVQDVTIPNDASRNPLFLGDDTLINSIAFGDGELDVADIYVTFRRSLDPSLQWFQRFWTNGIRAAQTFPNPSAPAPGPLPMPSPGAVTPEVQFLAGDGVVSAGQSVLIPVDAQVHGNLPLRLLALGFTIEPLEGSPAITNQVTFIPNVTLGSATLSGAKGAGNYAASWLNKNVAGLTGNVTLGTLQVTLPPNANSNSAYAVSFDHASASPNGLASFPRRARTGLLTLRDRSASSFGDGIPDSWRLRYFGSLNNLLSQPTADADGDGQSNKQEYLAGTNPNDAGSVLKLKSSKGQSAAVSVRWPSVAGKQYVIERASSIFAPVWSAVSTNSGTGWDMEYQDNSGGGGPRFYRVRVQ